MCRLSLETGLGAVKQQGFTLLEMMVVIAILAAVAGITTVAYNEMGNETDDSLVYSEMQEIAKAIRQFKYDTGYYPKTGPFALEDDGGSVLYNSLPSYAGSNNTERKRWFYSPANFYQLLGATSPLDESGHQLEVWSPETGRGWRGPYLSGYTQDFVDIRQGVNGDPQSAEGDVDGDPLVGLNIADVPGIADPFNHRSVVVGSDTLLDWSADPDGEERTKWGRPYLFLDLESDEDTVRMGLISMGYDGDYGTDDDIQLFVE